MYLIVKLLYIWKYWGRSIFMSNLLVFHQEIKKMIFNQIKSQSNLPFFVMQTWFAMLHICPCIPAHYFHLSPRLQGSSWEKYRHPPLQQVKKNNIIPTLLLIFKSTPTPLLGEIYELAFLPTFASLWFDLLRYSVFLDERDQRGGRPVCKFQPKEGQGWF